MISIVGRRVFVTRIGEEKKRFGRTVYNFVSFEGFALERVLRGDRWLMRDDLGRG